MKIYRSTMEKTLDEMENATVISNPKDRGRTFLRKIAYRTAFWKDRVQRFFMSGSKKNRPT